jgi:hypothetical protein
MADRQRIEGDRTTEERVRQLELTLEEVTSERTRLWTELQRRAALEDEVAYYKAKIREMEQSDSWRVTAPLRGAKRTAERCEDLARLAWKRLWQP